MPRIVDHAERRTQIVHALWLVIAQQGIEGVSLRHVAAAAGVSTGRIQHYFGTKEALVLAGCTALVDSAYGGYLETEQAPPRERLLHVVSQQIPRDDAGRAGVSVWYAYVARSINDDAVRQVLAEARRGAEDECARLIRAAGAGSAPPGTAGDPALVQARRLLALADGLTLRVLVGDLDPAEATAMLADEVRAS
ncbi:TetR/AcrR family transcriptional regulator [Promicromonospora thailandica]|uniref:Transcriptional regulator, TetR family n=1 Tax=Promicromonospora thailandica TaxID=765201 RepID=A0A9X2FX15_9MICO|nr:TetR/AcrR family transcriptional regulator [Promicromonospora thailandica]MCP2262900.1 transcriptional regulator, TetR family [Promicromonospora thailandica]BFF18245.1 TetR/AcrR family transcriptional regulator [Promicromonospora thailandica]